MENNLSKVNILREDVFKVIAYIISVLMLGAATAPLLYNVGMAVGEITERKETNGVLEWLGAAARRSSDNFPRFFDRTLLASAIILAIPLVRSLKRQPNALKFRDTPWSLYYPDDQVAHSQGQPLRKNQCGLKQLLLGFTVAAGVLLVAGFSMVMAGFFVWDGKGDVGSRGEISLLYQLDWATIIKKAVVSSVVVTLIEEILFRGVLLGIFLRAMKPAVAIVSLSLLFSFVHFLEPEQGVQVQDPESLTAGFSLLGHILERFGDPIDLVGRFLLLTAIGIVLAVARYRTASLCLPIGLHAGWIFGYTVFKAATSEVQGQTMISKLLVGGSLMEGLLPLIMILLTGIVVLTMTQDSFRKLSK